MAWNYSNTFTETTLTASVSNSATTISVASTSGLPVSFPYSLILDFEQPTVEVVTVTGLAGLNLTVIRGEDGTAAQSHNLGARVVHGVVARDVREPQTHIAASQDVHGVGASNSVVGTGTTQTLTNKTISGSNNTFTNIPASAVTQPFASVTSSGQVAVTRAASTDAAYGSKATGDTNDRFAERADGQLMWGSGSAPGDTNLYRPAADKLRTDDSLEVGGSLVVPNAGDGQVLVGASTAPSNAKTIAVVDQTGSGVFGAREVGDAHDRFYFSNSGNLAWGTGAATGDTFLYRTSTGTLTTENLTLSGDLALGSTSDLVWQADTNLYRSAANTLRTDDTFQAADLQVGTVSVPRGQVGRSLRTTSSASITTTETVVDSITFTAVAGRRYKLTWTGMYGADTAGTFGLVRFRWKAGASLDATGTSFRSQVYVALGASTNTPECLIDTVSGIPAGQTTIGVTLVRAAGTGSVLAAAGANEQTVLLLEDAGV